MVATALSLLAVKINIVLEININSSSSTGRGEGISDFKTLSIKVTFHFKIRWLASYFAIQGIQKEKERKHLRGSGEIAKKNKDLEKKDSMKRQVEVGDWKLGDDFYLLNLKKLPTFKMLWL